MKLQTLITNIHLIYKHKLQTLFSPWDYYSISDSDSDNMWTCEHVKWFYLKKTCGVRAGNETLLSSSQPEVSGFVDLGAQTAPVKKSYLF